VRHWALEVRSGSGSKPAGFLLTARLAVYVALSTYLHHVFTAIQLLIPTDSKLPSELLPTGPRRGVPVPMCFSRL